MNPKSFSLFTFSVTIFAMLMAAPMAAKAHEPGFTPTTPDNSPTGRNPGSSTDRGESSSSPAGPLGQSLNKVYLAGKEYTKYDYTKSDLTTTHPKHLKSLEEMVKNADKMNSRLSLMLPENKNYEP